MAGLTVNEGLSYIGNVLYKGATQEALTLGLFTNAAGTLSEISVWADITQPSGAGYAEISLTEGNFVVSATGVVTYPQQTWTATANWSPGDVTGYYVRNASNELVHIQYRDEGPYTMNDGQLYTVDLGIDTS